MSDRKSLERGTRSIDRGIAHSSCHVRDSPGSHPHPLVSNLSNFIVHLRLPFQLVLAPFMLWGAALARARVSGRFLVAFAVVHLGLYGGTTAYNSHYDRDEGPVGGLAAPPPAGPWLLPGSLVLQGLALAIAAWVGAGFFFVCLSFAVLGVLYSHPRTRWKGRPWLSWAVVMIGQGVLGTAAGILVQGVARPTREMTAGLTAAACLVGAIYPLTQLFQTDEDRARGDRTAAIALGRKGARAASMALFVVGASCVALSVYFAGRAWEGALLAATALPLIVGAAWVCAPEDARAIFRRVSLFQIATGGAFGAYAVLRLWRP